MSEEQVNLSSEGEPAAADVSYSVALPESSGISSEDQPANVTFVSTEEETITDTTTAQENILPAEQHEPGSTETVQTDLQQAQEQLAETIKPETDGMVLQSTAYTGERAAGITGRKSSIALPNGKIRVPDSVDTRNMVLTEVKNVRSLNFTSQLRDYHAFAQNNRLTFELYVRSDTKLSRPLQNAINQGTIIRRNIPGF